MDDEFARMVGESIAAAQPPSTDPYDDEEDDEEESEDDELGGAKLVGSGESYLYPWGDAER